MIRMSRKQKLAVRIFALLGATAVLMVFMRYNNAVTEADAAFYEERGLSFISKTDGKEFSIYRDNEWQNEFLEGVNIGAAKPGYFPGELGITEEDYLRWFGYISDMHAEVIRVYTTLDPAFYNALYEFNRTAEQPLYLMQGVWINEEDIATLQDAFAEDEKIKQDFVADAKNLVDIFHGNAVLPEKPGFASGEYTKDISPYVIGWIMGIEWDPAFVETTNLNSPGKTSFSGEYLYTEDASPFEVFLSEAGDAVLRYEAEEYRTTRALGFTNWVTTDMLEHPSEPYEKEDKAVVNTEHIKARSSFPAGLFAAYHIYPYYPDFLSYEEEYIQDVDENGEINTYRAYLEDLMAEHTVPVLVAEFGVPASRGKAHESLYSGYDQGNHDETEQGEIVVDLLQDIHSEGYCGGLVFTWQDEWFKRTWNTMDFDLADRRAYWSNPQTNEQEFGLMAFDPGEEASARYVDGDISDWSKTEPIAETTDGALYAASDEKYLYLMVATEGFDFGADTLCIPIDTIADQGNTAAAGQQLQFSSGADFMVRIAGADDARILVDAYYDSFHYLYAEQLGMIDKNSAFAVKDSGIFNPMLHCLSREIFLPASQQTLPFSSYETGLLSLGDANPEHEAYDSLTDYAVKDGNVEIRIPWQLLNVMDPSTKQIMGDHYENGKIQAQATDGFKIGMAVQKSGELATSPVKMAKYTWEAWDMPTYHERLKPSYYIIQEAFEALDEHAASAE
ncbi:hypothetical protein SAMN05216375_10541 [Trichococcus ilyis]|uniref:Family 2 glycosyl transferase n=2 Tax=Trichococcus ilyis TaxID=640938 RepID=A0A143YKW0_9LACT|nr:Hypothetical protein TR210_1109 [Trichococcus ilyis]SEI92409.1 hypothetical protein SAMN05216375_10541 [Trichococcus ilyis]